jgi:tRNA nucleotidyltransferase (CCA-adding enzyme)
MKVYLVGGAVRDMLLNRTPKDRDYVVVGATEQELLDDGFERVGKDFPVFLHPVTKDEWALARTERKVGRGYGGFEVETDDVTIEQDLERRDLTINSIAYDAEEDLYVDPHGGVYDLQRHMLRHTSDAFREDPLRVVRLARFYARYAQHGFTVAAGTMTLAAEVVDSGELDELPDERFWAELEKVFTDDGQPAKFFELLYEVGALNDVRFFRELFGPNVTSHSLDRIMRMARSVFNVIEPAARVDFFAAGTMPLGVLPMTFSTTRCMKLYAAQRDIRLIHTQNPATLVEFLTRISAWNSRTTADDLVALLDVVEDAGYNSLYPFESTELAEIIQAGRSVVSGPFQHLVGRAIGQAMMSERIVRVNDALNRISS